ncbi:MAG: ATP-dependent RecD-like DNA helicase [Lachnospiraceae bacterium]
MEQLEGYVEKIVYRNSENGYTVFSLATVDSDSQTCVGSFPFINEGEYLKVEGNYTNHSLYGAQFQVTGSQSAEPEDADAMERYLGSGAIKGVGEALAKRIVDRFGKNTFHIIENEPERLVEIKGISDRIAREIYSQFEEKREARDSMLYLQKYGIGTNMAVRIYNTYGGKMKEVLNQNPYRLAEDIRGLGFKHADDIAARLGFDFHSEFRIRAGLLYTLTRGSNAGHSYLPQEVLYRHASEILGMDSSEFDNVLDELCMTGRVIIKVYGDERRIYSATYYYTELNIARMLIDLNIEDFIPEPVILQRLTSVEQKLGIKLDELQEQALYKAMTHALLILTGGPGTGKTTTINSMIEMFEQEGLTVLLAAPTGRAAKRISEATGREARTLHRMLEFQPGSDDSEQSALSFQRNEENPLEADVIIVDEASMIDMHLMNALLKAITVGTRIIFSGDSRQLPSVGPGNVLSDMISSNAFSVVRLTKIFRQAESSDIIVNAHKINSGQHLILDNKSKDFFMMKRSDVTAITNVVLQLVRDKMPRYVGATPYDIQVLTPMRKGELGVEKLNMVLQNFLNPPGAMKKEKEYQGRIYREGDKVMQIKNDYQLEWKCYNKYGIAFDGGMGVFNGDMGIIKEINLFAECMTVIFDDNKEVEYSFQALDELDHAYAVTVHKSQGSEYPAVVIPLLSGPKPLMNRNLLYTAVTRASKCVTIVGSEAAVNQMIDNEDENKRFTGLKDAILGINNS